MSFPAFKNVLSHANLLASHQHCQLFGKQVQNHSRQKEVTRWTYYFVWNIILGHEDIHWYCPAMNNLIQRTGLLFFVSLALPGSFWDHFASICPVVPPETYRGLKVHFIHENPCSAIEGFRGKSLIIPTTNEVHPRNTISAETHLKSWTACGRTRTWQIVSITPYNEARVRGKLERWRPNKSTD